MTLEQNSDNYGFDLLCPGVEDLFTKSFAPKIMCFPATKYSFSRRLLKMACPSPFSVKKLFFLQCIFITL